MRALLILAIGLLAAGEVPLPVAIDREIVPLVRPTTALRVLTWNVLFDRTSADRRLPAMFALIAKADADVIVMQEVTDWFLERLLAQPWAQAYRRTTVGGVVQAPGGIFVLSRLSLAPARVVVLPSRLDRVGVLHEIDLGRHHLAIVGVHLDSMPNDRGIRVRQLATCAQALAGHQHAAIIGDCNFGDADRDETAAIDPAYADVWSVLHGAAPGFTWDIERNALARANSFPGEPSRRLDRVLLRSSRWRADAAEIIGDQPLRADDPLLFPSDHFGLLVRLRAVGP